MAFQDGGRKESSIIGGPGGLSGALDDWEIGCMDGWEIRIGPHVMA